MPLEYYIVIQDAPTKGSLSRNLLYLFANEIFLQLHTSASVLRLLLVGLWLHTYAEMCE